MKALKIESNNLAQYSRRDTLEISGIPVSTDENTNQLVCKLGNILGVSIKDEDISISHRLPVGKSNTAVALHTKTPAIIVKFVRRDVRNELYKSRKALKDKTSEQKFFINGSLTPKNKSLFKECLKVKRVLHYKFLWTRNGNIFIRKDTLKA